MSNKETGGPAFPVHPDMAAQLGCVPSSSDAGMTLRQYAAIKLKVPDSETDWLNDMIRQSIKDDFAAMAMDAFLSRDGGTYEQDAECAHKMADAMLKAREA